MVWFAIYNDSSMGVNNFNVRSVCHCDVGYLEYLINLYNGSGKSKLKSQRLHMVSQRLIQTCILSACGVAKRPYITYILT